jgi:hypothetical protein
MNPDVLFIPFFMAGVAMALTKTASALLLNRIDKDDPIFAKLFSRTALGNLMPSEKWLSSVFLNARYYFPWVPSPNFEGYDTFTRSTFYVARYSGFLIIISFAVFFGMAFFFAGS